MAAASLAQPSAPHRGPATLKRFPSRRKVRPRHRVNSRSQRKHALPRQPGQTSDGPRRPRTHGSRALDNTPKLAKVIGYVIKRHTSLNGGCAILDAGKRPPDDRPAGKDRSESLVVREARG